MLVNIIDNARVLQEEHTFYKFIYICIYIYIYRTSIDTLASCKGHFCHLASSTESMHIRISYMSQNATGSAETIRNHTLTSNTKHELTT